MGLNLDTHEFNLHQTSEPPHPCLSDKLSFPNLQGLASTWPEFLEAGDVWKCCWVTGGQI